VRNIVTHFHREVAFLFSVVGIPGSSGVEREAWKHQRANRSPKIHQEHYLELGNSYLERILQA
jgi:hypothetical protein